MDNVSSVAGGNSSELKKPYNISAETNTRSSTLSYEAETQLREWYKKGTSLMQQGQNQEALVCFGKMLQLVSKRHHYNRYVWLCIATCKLNLWDPGKHDELVLAECRSFLHKCIEGEGTRVSPEPEYDIFYQLLAKTCILQLEATPMPKSEWNCWYEDLLSNIHNVTRSESNSKWLQDFTQKAKQLLVVNTVEEQVKNALNKLELTYPPSHREVRSALEKTGFNQQAAIDLLAEQGSNYPARTTLPLAQQPAATTNNPDDGPSGTPDGSPSSSPLSKRMKSGECMFVYRYINL